MTTEKTWPPHDKHGRLTRQSDLPDTVFAFPGQRNIQRAARYYALNLPETGRGQLGVHLQQNGKAAAAKAAATVGAPAG